MDSILSDSEKKEYSRKNAWILLAYTILMLNDLSYIKVFLIIMAFVLIFMKVKEDISLIESGNEIEGSIIGKRKVLFNIYLKVEIEVEGRIYKNVLVVKSNINKDFLKGDKIRVYYKGRNPKRFTLLEAVAPKRFKI